MPIEENLLSKLFIGSIDQLIELVDGIPTIEVFFEDDENFDGFIDRLHLSQSITIPSIVLPKSAHKKILGVEYKYFNKRFSRRVVHLVQFGKNRRIKNKNKKRAFGRFTRREPNDLYHTAVLVRRDRDGAG